MSFANRPGRPDNSEASTSSERGGLPRLSELPREDTSKTELRLVRRPFVSFLTTAYQTEDYLTEMIDSVLVQTSPDWELVIVDNGLSDAVVHIVDS